MKKFLVMILILSMVFALGACSPAEPEEPETPEEPEENVEPETLTGSGEGFKGEIVVEVTKEGDTITDVKVLSNNETPNVAKDALEQIPGAIVEANSTEVDVIAGATYTSDGIIYAVNNALDPETYPAPVFEVEEEEDPEAMEAADVYRGFGYTTTPRKGPGSDNEEVQVWSFNMVFADVLFDQDGKILSIFVDQTEVASPNYDGSGMPHFSGYPGQGGYNYDENHDEVVEGKTEDTEEWFMDEISKWQTKRERGESYQMATGTWASQMDTYQKAFIGKTVEEVEEWFAKYTSDRNGRILKPDTDNEEDKAKYEALSEKEKQMVTDVVAGASMSLKDGHGDIIGAIVESFENRVDVDITVK
ncbi:MAG: FMN-binding protein [Bacillota bacterium]|nr:FMN-binding protein [Bacillota bacterium]